MLTRPNSKAACLDVVSLTTYNAQVHIQRPRPGPRENRLERLRSTEHGIRIAGIKT